MQHGALQLGLRGRADEVRALDAVLVRAGRGRMQAAVVRGEPGLGKSRLLAEALTAAQRRGFRCLHGRADELERSRPFAPLLEAFKVKASSPDPACAGIANLLLTPQAASSLPVAEAGTQYQVAERFVDLLDRYALEQPVALVLDDVQWADTTSLACLRSMVGRLSDLPIALLCALRPWPARPELARILDELRDGGAIELDVEPLAETAVVELTREALGAAPGPSLTALMSEARGNALFVVELLRSLVDEEALARRDGTVELERAQLPPTLRLTVLRRLSVLPAATLETLRVASVLGSALDPEDLGAVLGAPAVELMDRLAPARELGIVEARGERIAFRHDLIRESLYEDIPYAVRRALHRDAARALSGGRRSPLAAAEQFALSAAPGDEEAIAWLREAAREAAPRGTAIAVELLETSLGLCDATTPQRAEIAGELAVLLAVAGRAEEAGRLAQELHSLDPGSAPDTALRIGLAEALWNRGDVASALEHFEHAAAAPPAGEPYRSIGAAFAAQLAMLAGDVDAAVEAVADARASAADEVRPAVEVVAYETLALIAAAQGSYDEAVEHGTEALRRTANVTSEWTAYLYPHIYLALVQLEADRFDDARATVTGGRERAEVVGNVSWLPALGWIRAGADTWSGAWADAVAEAEAALELAGEVGNSYGMVFGHTLLAWIALHRGELAEARALLDAAERLVEETGPGLGTDLMLCVEALLTEATGDATSALDALELAHELTEPVRYLITFRALAPPLVRLAVAHGRRDLAETVTAEAERAATRARAPSVKATALRCRGLLHGDPDALRAAAAEYALAPRPLDSALAYEEAAELLLAGDRRDDAVASLGDALDLHAELGSARHERRVAALLRELGAPRGARGPRRRAAHGWESLTATEERVARLAAQRLTNGEIGERLFISSRTVQTHLKHIFAKLDIASRRDVGAHLPPD